MGVHTYFDVQDNDLVLWTAEEFKAINNFIAKHKNKWEKKLDIVFSWIFKEDSSLQFNDTKYSGDYPGHLKVLLIILHNCIHHNIDGNLNWTSNKTLPIMNFL